MTSITSFILILAIAFPLILFTAVLISYCKRRQSRTRHGLTGMCHQTGGAMCGSCGSQLQAKPNHTHIVDSPEKLLDILL